MKKKILPAAQYDALKAAADKNGGVGSAQMRDSKGCGVCGYGLAFQAGILVPPPVADLKAKHFTDSEDNALDLWLYDMSADCALPFDYGESDDAVQETRRRMHGRYTPRSVRVPFEAWAEQLGLVRGE